MAGKLPLGGREYEHVGGPLCARHDLFIMQHARFAGLSGIGEGETPDAYMERLLASCLSSGRALLILGALLWPAGTKPEQWDEEMAYATAAHLGGVTDPEEKAKLYAELGQVLLGFFESGLGSWVASARAQYSAAGAETEAGSNPTTTTSTPGTGSGRPSSEPSPATTTTARRSL